MYNPILSKLLASLSQKTRKTDKQRSRDLAKWSENADPNHAAYAALYKQAS